MLNSSDSMPGRTPVQGPDEIRHGLAEQSTATNEAPSLANKTLLIADVDTESSSQTPHNTPKPESNPPTTSPSPAPPKRDLHLHVDVALSTKQSPFRQAGSAVTSPEASPSSSWSAVYSPNELTLRPGMSFTGDKKVAVSGEDNARTRISTWYMRRSRPPADTLSDDHSITSTEATPTKLRHVQTVDDDDDSVSPTPTKVTPAATGSRFGFFASSMSAIKGLTSSPVAIPQDDELMNLDLNAALFPRGAPADGEAFSPAAFKNLQATATGLLNKFQVAYQQRTVELRELKVERDTHQDEKSELHTRTQHLKMQLEEMAQKASETEAVMQALMNELAKEKQLRAGEQTSRGKSTGQSEGSVSEDLGVEEDQRTRTWRRSGGTAKSDLSFDTDEESIEEASLFSRSRSPTLAMSVSDIGPVDHLPPLPTPPPPQSSKPAMLQPPRSARQSQPQMTAFQKLFKGISGDGSTPTGAARGVDGCRNCHGQEASVAWDTASLLRDENKGLKQRVGELESAIEDALDVVNGVGL